MLIPAHLFAHLPYFSAVAKYQSFTLAAESLFVSQAAVSYHIRQLEMKLDVLLVVRQSGSCWAEVFKLALQQAIASVLKQRFQTAFIV